MTENADLLFSKAPATSGDLVFGETGAGRGAASAVVVGSFPKLQAAVQVARLRLVSVSGSFRALQGAADVHYSSGTARPTVAATRAQHQIATKLQEGPQHRQQDTDAAPAGWAAFWQRATGACGSVQTPINDTERTADWPRAAAHQNAAPVRASSVFAHQDADRAVRRMLSAIFQDCAPIRLPTGFKHQDADHSKRIDPVSWWGETTRAGRPFAAPYTRGTHAGTWRQACHQGARRPPAGISRPTTPTGPQPCCTPNSDLVFSWPSRYGSHLVFQCGSYVPVGDQPAKLAIPVKRFYMVKNEVKLVKYPEGIELQAKAFTMSVDRHSWTWSFSATLQTECWPHVQRSSGGAPVEIGADINGVEYRFLVENRQRDGGFAARQVRITGRGLSAVLDQPLSRVKQFGNSTALSARQLMEHVLSDNGASIGWSVDWQIDDWFVPPGLWSIQGSYIDAIKDIAFAAGAYIQPHPTDQIIRVLPLYPVAPWDWSDVTPDIELPSSICEVEGIKSADKPAYDRVYVGGVGGGVFGPVTRSGSAGSNLAPQVTHALITDATVHRARGISVLADAGAQSVVTASAPVLPGVGLILPGSMLRYVDGDASMLGIVRANDVTWSYPKLRQTIEVEVHV